MKSRNPNPDPIYRVVAVTNNKDVVLEFAVLNEETTEDEVQDIVQWFLDRGTDKTVVSRQMPKSEVEHALKTNLQLLLK